MRFSSGGIEPCLAGRALNLTSRNREGDSAQEFADAARAPGGSELRVHRLVDRGVLEHAGDVVLGLEDREPLDPVDPPYRAGARVTVRPEPLVHVAGSGV